MIQILSDTFDMLYNPMVERQPPLHISYAMAEQTNQGQHQYTQEPIGDKGL